MVGYDAKTISTLNDEELDLLIDTLKQEKRNRENSKREKLINAFEKAWLNLKEAGISVIYTTEAYNDYNIFEITSVDDFEYN